MEASVREALRRAIALEHNLFLEAQKHERDAERWRQRADLAYKRGEIDLARQALDRQGQAEQRADRYREQYWTQVELVRTAKIAAQHPNPIRPVVATAPSVEAQIHALEQADRIERDLAALKEKLGRAQNTLA